MSTNMNQAVAGVVVGVSAAAAALVHVSPWFVLAATVLLVFVVVPWSYPVPRWLCTGLTLFAFATLLPANLSPAVQFLALAVPFAVWWRSERRGRSVVYAVAAITALWLLLLLLPNVPDLQTGLLGVRKTTLALAGIVLGCSIARSQRMAVETFVVRLLVAVLAVSVVVHLWLPQVEAGIQRGASAYSGEFNGTARLQGILPGPFHVAIAAAFLVGWALLRFRVHRRLAIAALIVGAIALDQAMVRTGYVAIAVALAILVGLAPSFTGKLRRVLIIGAVVLLAVCAVSIVGGDNRALTSLTEGTSDSRFQSRIPTYTEGLQYFERSPVFGWGPGSAGDTLGDAFGSDHVFVTPHSVFLKILVEGGLVGALLWLGLFVAILRRTRFRSQFGGVSAVALGVMLTFGLSGSMIEALPITYLLCILVGQAIDR
jgi:O-antigen ligase